MKELIWLLVPMLLQNCSTTSHAELDPPPSFDPSCGAVVAHPDATTRCVGLTVAFDEAGETYADLAAAFANAAIIEDLFICPGSYGLQDITVSNTDLRIAAASGTFNDTTLDGGGAGMLTFSNANISMYNLSLLNGQRLEGGAINSSASDLDLFCMEFEDHQASADGGAIYFAEGELLVESSSFSDNTAGTAGGAVKIGGTQDSQVTFVDVLFDTNTAGTRGGAIAMGDTGRGASGGGDKLLMVSTDLIENEATGSGGIGGAVYIYNESWSEVEFLNTNFTTNKSAGGLTSGTGFGGALYVDGNASAEFDIWVQNAEFEENEAASGAAIEIASTIGDADIDLVNALISRNFSEEEAGAVEFGTDVFLWSNETNWGLPDGTDNVDLDILAPCGEYGELGAGEIFQCQPGIEGLIRP